MRPLQCHDRSTSFLRRACELVRKIATGHYAAIGRAENGRYFVTRGGETIKDQSYFLFMLSQEALSDILFLGGFKSRSGRWQGALLRWQRGRRARRYALYLTTVTPNY